MDQDFHYYGTFMAARKGGFTKAAATLIAKAANFIDFLNEKSYPSSWTLVGGSKSYTITPRFTFQGDLFQTYQSPQDGLWCSFHFPPGNYPDPAGSPTREAVHGAFIAGQLPAFTRRDTNGGKAILTKYNAGSLGDLSYGNLLTRPQSALSRSLILDAIKCATDETRLKAILAQASGGTELLTKPDVLLRFKLILLGVRAHVIADTWAHQDFCGLHNILNTYWDVNYDPKSWDPSKMGYGRQSVDYNDGTTASWKNKTLSVSYKLTQPNFEATPNGTSYLGHGWMGHFPDFGFLRFRYKPCWADPQGAPVERNNPAEYKAAWLELLSLFSQASGAGQLKASAQFQTDVGKALMAIQTPCNLEGADSGRKVAAFAWLQAFKNDPDCSPATLINVVQEPDPGTVMAGRVGTTNNVQLDSDLYLFQIAADYHFRWVQAYLSKARLYTFSASWSQQPGPLSPAVDKLF